MNYHMPDESGELDRCFEKHHMNDGQEELRVVEPEELVSWLQQDRH